MAEIDQQQLADLQELRTQTQKFFENQRLTVREVLEVKTNLTTFRLLSYQYYQDSELGDDLAKLNSILNVSNVEGTVKVFTE